jgi:hypothetical protein
MPATPDESFDAEYYRRFYRDPVTRVHGVREIARLARGVSGTVRWFGGKLDTVLDVGAGTGLWRDWMVKHVKGVRYRSIEVSAHACEAYGHERQDISRWKVNDRFDLVICQGVLPYLDDDACSRAIDNIGAMSGGFLYLEAITKRDLEEVCDRDLTDVKVHPRTGAWYRERLDQHFEEIGCGLWYRKRAGGRALGFYELEAASFRDAPLKPARKT